MKKPKKEPSPWPSTIDLKIKKSSHKERKGKIFYNAKCLMNLGYTVDKKNMIFESNYTKLMDFPTPARYYARMLIRLGFKHQLQLFS